MRAETAAAAKTVVDTTELLNALLAFKNGDFSVRLPADRTGGGKVYDVLNEIFEQNEQMTREFARISNAVGKEGRIKQRAGTLAKGGYAACVESVNSLISDLVQPSTKVARVIGAVAKGDLTQKMALEVEGRSLKGEFLHTARVVNAMVDQLNSFASEVTRVAKEVGTEGKLGGQAEVLGVAGTWKDLTDSVNNMASNLTNQVRNIAGVTEQTQQLHEANRELRHLSSRIVAIRDEERRRLGRELHDSQGQYLAAIKMNLEMIETTDAALSAVQKSALTEAITLLERSMHEIRVISHLLHPPLLDEIGLQAVVPWYLNSFSERSGIQIDLDMPSDIAKLPDQVELAVFRVLQECLTNVHRHSGSKVAKVRILPEETSVTLEVLDRGRGLSSQNGSDPVMGVGITGMRERVRELAGHFEINSSSEGTVVRAVLPFGEQIGNHTVKLQSDLA